MSDQDKCAEIYLKEGSQGNVGLFPIATVAWVSVNTDNGYMDTVSTGSTGKVLKLQAKKLKRISKNAENTEMRKAEINVE